MTSKFELIGVTRPAATANRLAPGPISGCRIDRSFFSACLTLFLVAASVTSFAGSAQTERAVTSSVAVTTNSLLGGTRFETPYYIHDSGVAGPTVFIIGGVHGNEPAGAVAAESARHLPITKGRLVVLPRANVPALKASARLTPGVDSGVSNLNRNYPMAGETGGARGELAQAIWQLAHSHKPDWVLDLHEGYDFHQLNEKSVGSSIIVFPNETGKAAADLMLAAVNRTISEPALQFVRRDLPVDGSLARAAGEHLHVPGMTLETTSKQPLEKRVRQHHIMVHALLKHINMVSEPLPEIPAGIATISADVPAKVRIALYRGPGTGGNGPPSLLKRLNAQPATSIVEITPEQIRQGLLTNYHVVIFGGGSGSKQAEALEESGRAAVQEFVGNGGGYIGICAGAYLATSGYEWSLKLIDARTVSPKWRRGRGTVKMELTDNGRKILGEQSNHVDVLYANGPIVAPAGVDSLPDFEALAWFRTELAENDSPVGVMVNSPAIFAGEYRRGRVVCVSPHPEQTKGLEHFVPQVVQWVAPKIPEAAAAAN